MSRAGTSSTQQVTVLVFHGDHAATPVERLMADGWAACALDTIDLALACPLVDRVIAVTNSDALAARAGALDRVEVERDQPGEPFHFGRALQRAIQAHDVSRPLYFGAAAAPLLSPATLEDVCRRLLAAERTVVTNNAGSADFFGFSPAGALGRIPLPESGDNSLPRLLARQAGLQVDVLPPTVEATFDVDTPTDLAILSVQTAIKPHARRYVESQTLDTSRLERAMPALILRDTRKTLIGRVKTEFWGTSELGIRGPTRMFIEERAMQSYGRHTRGEVRSLLAHLYEAIGAERFFARLSEYSDVVLFDSRPLLYHLSPGLARRPERFLSDLGQPDGIEDPMLREFTAAALACPVPVILGGQNVVAGALWALVQEAWDRADAGLLAVQPD